MTRSPGRQTRRGVWIGLLALAVALTVSCGGSRDPEVARSRVNQDLAGRWRLVSFVPETELDPMLQNMLAFYNNLIISFEGGRVKTQSPGLNFDRAYRIEDPQEPWFKVIITDDQGVSYLNIAQFDEAGRLNFRCLTPPWQGSGVLEREGAALGQ